MSVHTKLGLVVIAAAGAISMPVYHLGDSTQYSKHRQVSADVRNLTTALQAYRRTHNAYPSTLQTLTQQRQLQILSRDPWHRDYVYRAPGVRARDGFDLFSAGADGRAYTADDDWGGDQ